MYHRFGESKYPSTNTTTEQVEQHLSYLKDKNFNFILAKDLLNPEALSTKTISITVDDAYLSFYEVGLPIFEKFNIPVTLFLNTENVGGNNYMSWSQLKETLNRGVDIQNHTHSHCYNEFYHLIIIISVFIDTFHYSQSPTKIDPISRRGSKN